MTVYNINLGIGWASSGVEYAQAYRAQLLRNIHQPAKFAFMDMILADNIQHLNGNAMLQSQTAARTDLRFIPCRQSHIKTGWPAGAIRFRVSCL